MAYQIEITKTAEKQIKKSDKNTQLRIIKFLKEIAICTNPKQKGKALKGNKVELWRYRIGDYRLICEINLVIKIVKVLEVGHRKEIYK